MDYSRRAQPVPSIAESRRSNDNYRPVTNSSYGTMIPIVIGQQRVPSTVFRDARSVQVNGEEPVLHYGLCEGPLASIRRMYANKGMTVDLGTAKTLDIFPTAHLPWVAVRDIPATDSPPDRSYEVSSDIPLSGGNGEYIVSAVDTYAPTDAVNGLTKIFTDCHHCITGSGLTATQYVVVWSSTSQSINLYWRVGTGAWALKATLTSLSTRPSICPASAAFVQPRVAAVGNLIHVVWSLNTATAGPVNIAHIWSTDGGFTWTVGQNLTVTPSTGGVNKVSRLQIALHAGGDLWVSASAWPARGVIVGYLPPSTTAATPWVIPMYVDGYDWEYMRANHSYQLGIWYPAQSDEMNRTRSPSIFPIGNGKAMISVTHTIPVGTAQAALRVLPIIADTVVRFDLPDAAFQRWGGEDPSVKNVVLNDWLNANGYLPRWLNWNAEDFEYNEALYGYTQIIGISSTRFAVLCQNRPMYSTLPNKPPETWGAWKMYWGTINPTNIVWDPPAQEWVLATTTDYAYMPTAFYNGNGQIFVALGKKRSAIGGAYPYDITSSPELKLYVAPADGSGNRTEVLDYAPSTALNNSVSYQHWASNGEIISIMREDDDGNGTIINGVRLVSQTPSVGDVLPSVICKRILTDPIRGLGLKNIIFDDDTPTSTWVKFDQYCEARGIRFSLLLTSQEAAWPLVCNILDSANAVPYRSEGKLKVWVRETATIGAYTPLPEHASPCRIIPPGDLRDGISVDGVPLDQRWNRLTVNWKNRSRAYADDVTSIEDAGSVARIGPVPASTCDWHWITTEQTAMTCAWLRLRHQQRTLRQYTFTVSMRYMLHEPGDIIQIEYQAITPRPVRILSMSKDSSGWIEMVCEDVVVGPTAINPPMTGSGGSGVAVAIASPVNLPIIFIALIGGILQVWILLSGGAGWRGCAVEQSWDGTHWETVGYCNTPSPTGTLIQSMDRLRVQPGLRVRPGLLLGLSDYALGDYSESLVLPPFPVWGDFLAGNPGALLWIDGELVGYGTESDNGETIAQCNMLRRGLYGTTRRPHSIGVRMGAVTDSAFTWPLPSGFEGRTCYWRFPSYGEDPNAVATYSVEIPA